MKTLQQHINEKLVINKGTKSVFNWMPETVSELRHIIEDKFKENKKYLDCTDINISKLDTLSEYKGPGLFTNTAAEIINVTGWDTSNVTNLNNLFDACHDTQEIIGLEDWDVSSVSNFGCLFNHCHNITTLNLSKWNTISAEYMEHLFNHCDALESVGDLSRWKTGKVKDMENMFRRCYVLKDPGDLGEWDMKCVVDISKMFYYCKGLNHIGDIGRWKFKDLQWASEIFKYNEQLKSPGNLNNWEKSIEKMWGVSDVAKTHSVFNNAWGEYDYPSWW